MSRRIRLFIILAALVPVLLFSFHSFAKEPAPKTLETVLKQIEYRHYRWVAFRADTILFFVAPGSTRQAMCGGELLYNRLDERMLLSCYDSSRNLVFVFRTLDRRFDLYIPSQNTLYHGSVFDLESSPEVESHLKPIDLYRALKTSMFDPRHTELDLTGGIKVVLNVFGDKNGEPYLSRKAYVTPEGDVIGELFFDSDAQVLTEIQRHDFQEFHERVGSFKSVFFPKKVTIISPETGKNTVIFFNKIKALDSIETYQFLLRIPQGTKEVFLKEVDPRFSLRAVEAAQNKSAKENAAELAATIKETVPVASGVTGEKYAEKELPAQNSADADIAIE